MRLKETLNAPATTTLTVTERSVWLDLYDQFINDRDKFVVIFDQEPAAFSGDPTTILESARFVGRPIRARADGFELMTMPGMYDVPGRNLHDLRPQSLPGSLSWSTYLAQMVHGNVALSAAPAGSKTLGLSSAIPRLEIFEAAADAFGVSWRLDRLGRVVWSTSSTDVFPASASLAVLGPGVSGDPDYVSGIPAARGQVTGYSAEFGHWSWNVVASYDSGASEVWTSAGGGSDPRPGTRLLPDPIVPANPYHWEPGRTLDLGAVSDPTEASGLAQAFLGRFAAEDGPRISFNLTVEALPDGDLQPGEVVWVFAPDLAIEDTTQPSYNVNGTPMHPRRFFVSSVDAPTRDDMCVVIYSSDAQEWSTPLRDAVDLSDSRPETVVTGTTEIPPIRIDGGTAKPPTPIIRESNPPERFYDDGGFAGPQVRQRVGSIFGPARVRGNPRAQRSST